MLKYRVLTALFLLPLLGLILYYANIRFVILLFASLLFLGCLELQNILKTGLSKTLSLSSNLESLGKNQHYFCASFITIAYLLLCFVSESGLEVSLLFNKPALLFVSFLFIAYFIFILSAFRQVELIFIQIVNISIAIKHHELIQRYE